MLFLFIGFKVMGCVIDENDCVRRLLYKGMVF